MVADAVEEAARTAMRNAIPVTTAKDRLAHMRVYHRLEWQRELATAAHWARHLGATWQQIGAAVGIDADTARHLFATPATWRGNPFLPQDPEWSPTTPATPADWRREPSPLEGPRPTGPKVLSPRGRVITMYARGDWRR